MFLLYIAITRDVLNDYTSSSYQVEYLIFMKNYNIHNKYPFYFFHQLILQLAENW